MASRTRTAIVVLLAVVVAGLAIIYFRRPAEPVYEGKPLTAWLEQFGTNQWGVGHGKGLDLQAQNALLHIGTNAAPIYLQWLTTRESSIKVKWLTLAPESWLSRFQIPTLAEYQNQLDTRKTLGAYGFVALGDKAKPFVPDLMALNRDKDQRTRYLAVFALRCLGPAAAEALPEMIECLNDPELTIRCDAATAVGEIHQEPEKSVRALMAFLEKYRKERIHWLPSMMAVESLGKFGAQAKPAVPMLVGWLNDPQEGMRQAATNALKNIDPDAAAKAGVRVYGAVNRSVLP